MNRKGLLSTLLLSRRSALSMSHLDLLDTVHDPSLGPCGLPEFRVNGQDVNTTSKFSVLGLVLVTVARRRSDVEYL